MGGFSVRDPPSPAPAQRPSRPITARGPSTPGRPVLSSLASPVSPIPMSPRGTPFSPLPQRALPIAHCPSALDSLHDPPCSLLRRPAHFSSPSPPSRRSHSFNRLSILPSCLPFSAPPSGTQFCPGGPSGTQSLSLPSFFLSFVKHPGHLHADFPLHPPQIKPPHSGHRRRANISPSCSRETSQKPAALPCYFHLNPRRLDVPICQSGRWSRRIQLHPPYHPGAESHTPAYCRLLQLAALSVPDLPFAGQGRYQ